MQWWQKRDKEQAEKNLFARNLAKNKSKFGSAGNYAANLSLKETLRETDPALLRTIEANENQRAAANREIAAEKATLETAELKLQQAKKQMADQAEAEREAKKEKREREQEAKRKKKSGGHIYDL